MTPDPFAETADLLARLRLERETIDRLSAGRTPRDLASGYAIQAALVARLERHHGGSGAGYKIACTNKYAQALLNTDAPVFGRLSSCFVHESPARIPSGDFAMLGIEAEFAFHVARDVPPREAPYTAETIRDFLGPLIPAIELVGHRFSGWDKFDAPTLAADNAVHQGFIAGMPVEDWRHLDLPAHPVALTVNGELELVGRGANVLNDPLNAMAWLANELPGHELSLSAGDVVTTGTCTDVYVARPGDAIIADFGELGRVEIAFT